MCGIFVALRKEGYFDTHELEEFGNACNVINHRGPDGSGVFQTDFTKSESSKSNLFLGHKRLSILDLAEAANQPFRSNDHQMVYNGEVFNYLELQQEELRAKTLRTSSDTEVVLELYKKLGINCFSQFNGMWALAIYDEPNHKMIICRDRFSIKPLYYLRLGDDIYFASEIKQLKEIKKANFTPNQGVIGAFLNQGLLDHSEDTFYSEIKQFPAQHALEIDLSSWDFNWTHYWDYASENSDQSEPPSKRFKELLIDSLSLRLRSDVPVGTLLSGGLDSSAISVLIKENIKPDVKTFSVVSGHEKFSEEKYIDILVNERGISNEKLRFDTGLALGNVDKVLNVQDEPYGSLSVVAQHQLFQQIKSETGITVLLSGQGADEILLGYSKFFFFHLKALLKRGKIGSFSQAALSSWIKGTTVRDFNFSEAKRYLPGSRNKGQNYLTGQIEGEAIWGFDDMRSRQILDINKYSVPALAHYEDRNSMDASIEVRLPFLDYRLVNFLINLPVEQKLKNGWTKHILRESVSELPDPIRWRKDKKGFTTPEELWMKGELGDEIDALFSSSRKLEELGMIDNQLFKESLKQFRNGSRWISHGDLFRVFITEKWLAQF